MKRKVINDKTKVNGFYIKDLERGFMGSSNEGKAMLKRMGLPEDTVPFSIAKFIHARKVFWKDGDGATARIHFKLKPDQMECFGSYRGKRKSYRLFREWENYDDP